MALTLIRPNRLRVWASRLLFSAVAMQVATLAGPGTAAGQAAAPALPNSPAQAAPVVPAGAPMPAAGTNITLDEALTRARANEPAFNAAVAAQKSASYNRSIARAALLPNVDYHNQFLYTQGARYAHIGTISTITTTGASPQVPGQQTFIANNAVHEYISQGSVTETLGFKGLTALSQASAEAAIATAELEVARRGLTASVVQLFYASTTAEEKVKVEQRALSQADDFVKQTQAREDAREAAHADVIKAQLTQQQRQRDVADAQLALEKARLDLAVLLFADPRTPYSVSIPASQPLPSRAQIEVAANNNNPELRSALATLRARTLDITATRAAYFPDLSLNYLYGIDAPQFAVNGRRSVGSSFDDAPRNLGYGVIATLDIPVFDWFATQNRIRQARALRDAAKVQLSSAERTLIAQLEEFYNEATLASQQLTSLDLTVTTARESLRLTRMRYTAGEATVLEVVDAQNTLTQAELAKTDGIVRYQVSLANLQLLTGTI